MIKQRHEREIAHLDLSWPNDSTGIRAGVFGLLKKKPETLTADFLNIVLEVVGKPGDSPVTQHRIPKQHRSSADRLADFVGETVLGDKRTRDDEVGHWKLKSIRVVFLPAPKAKPR